MSENIEQVKLIISNKTGLDVAEIASDCFFEDDLNVSELEMIEILGEIEEKLQIEFEEEETEKIETFADLEDILTDKID